MDIWNVLGELARAKGIGYKRTGETFDGAVAKEWWQKIGHPALPPGGHRGFRAEKGDHGHHCLAAYEEQLSG